MSVTMKLLRVNAITELIRSSLTTTCSLCRKSVNPKRSLQKREITQNKLSLTQIVTDHEIVHKTNSLNDFLTDEDEASMLHDDEASMLHDDEASMLRSKGFSESMSVEEILQKYPHKVKDLALTLNITLFDTAVLFQKYKFLTNSKMATINSKINFLLEKDISKEELLNDLWILTYNIPTLEKRMQLLTNLKLKPIKPWLLRCNDHMLHRMSMNRESNRLALGSSKTVADFLKERLQLSDAQVLYFASRYPAVLRVKVAKLKEIIDFLYSEGFSSYHIYQTPRILCHSLITIKERLQELSALKYELHSLALLCKSKRYFRKILMNFEKESRS